jgi:hypothetical protein
LIQREERRLEKATDIFRLAQAALEAAMADLQQRKQEWETVKSEVESRVAAVELVKKMNEEFTNEAQSAPFKNLVQDEAIRAVLLAGVRKMNSSEIADGMIAGGYEFTSSNPPNSVVVAANKNVRGYFTTERDGNRTLVGLKEWQNTGEQAAA